MDDEKMIRFIDSQYNDLFYIRDGESIVLTRYDGEKLIRPCKFLDECHTQVGNNVFHICEFAERMERNGTSYVPEQPQKLPDKCFSTLPTTGELIVIEKNVDGYKDCKGLSERPDANRRFAWEHNRSRHVTPQQEAAMLGGALYGWKTRAARTTSYDLRGTPVIPLKAMSAKTKGQERLTARQTPTGADSSANGYARSSWARRCAPCQ